MNQRISKVSSETISLMRFPCSVMVVMIHCYMAADFKMENVNWLSISSEDVNGVFQVFFSHVFSHIAVPTFYLFDFWFPFLSKVAKLELVNLGEEIDDSF